MYVKYRHLKKKRKQKGKLQGGAVPVTDKVHAAVAIAAWETIP